MFKSSLNFIMLEHLKILQFFCEFSYYFMTATIYIPVYIDIHFFIKIDYLR